MKGSVHAVAALGGERKGKGMEDVERVFFTLDSLPGRIRWLVEQAPTDLEPVWPYGGCGVEACTALAHFLKPCTRLGRARRIERVEFGSRVAAADNELRDWERRVRSGFNPIKRRPKRRNEVIASALSNVARQIDDYLQCRPALTPRQWVEQALTMVGRLDVWRPGDSDYQHGISLALSGLEQALDQFPE
ncbi:hypothetical protein [Lysobacter antibioticus]|uniref:hypothetical protein n=1 Tax=Lysobacter antibioticus TaxID=84531 RepID=UPI001269FC68|nr:hypothetical protein [Lysobacter antibioticus]